jgi:hypothetical protein
VKRRAILCEDLRQVRVDVQLDQLDRRRFRSVVVRILAITFADSAFEFPGLIRPGSL